MERITANLQGQVRREKLGGRDYLVAPLTLIVPGVLNGSQGPLFYPQEEIGKDPAAWNHMPIVVYHPEVDDQPVSAREPDVLNAQGVGFVFHASANGKLTGEGWFDIENTRRIDNRVLSALEKNEAIELSTGLFTDNEPAEEGAVYNGVAYTHIARNYRPDHLAILPDQIGACSIADGCGVLVNEDKRTLWQRLGDLLGVNATKKEGSEELPASAYAYVPDPSKPSTWKLRIDDAAHVGGAVAAIGKGFRGQRVQIPSEDMAAVKRKIRTAWLKFHPDKSADDLPGVLTNELSHDDLRQLLRQKIISKITPGPDESLWVSEVFDDSVVYELEGQLFRLGYASNGNEVLLSDQQPIKVKRVTSFEPITDNQTKGDVLMKDTERKAIVDDLIANTCCWEETDREVLMNLSDDHLTRHKAQVEKDRQRDAVVNAAKEGFEDQQGDHHVFNEATGKWENKPSDKVTTNTSGEPTEEDWLAKAPASVREDLAFARNEKSRQKAALIERLTANIADAAAKQQQAERLSSRSLTDLQADVALLPEQKQPDRQPSYIGAAVPVGNEEEGFAGEDLDMAPPAMDYGKTE